jgi:hypothetical protein
MIDSKRERERERDRAVYETKVIGPLLLNCVVDDDDTCLSGQYSRGYVKNIKNVFGM